MLETQPFREAIFLLRNFADRARPYLPRAGGFMLQYGRIGRTIMAYITINPEGCKACLLCIDFCPRGCIAVSEQRNSRGFHPATFVNAEGCTGCRMCATMCPDVCIEVFREDVSLAASQAETHE